MPLLSVEHVTRRFGGVLAVDDVSVAVEARQIAGLIGPNGAGKTTLFNLITRLYEPDSGEILFDGESVLRAPAYRVIGRGIARTFQNIELFDSMTVRENVQVGVRGDVDVDETLEALELDGLAYQPVAGLPFGTQKRVELARALASRPRLLLLDEPAGGLNHEEVGELGALIRRIGAAFELTILLVEHHMNLVMGVADRVHVLDFGRKIAEGTPSEVQANRAVIEAYLGSDQPQHAPA